MSNLGEYSVLALGCCSCLPTEKWSLAGYSHQDTLEEDLTLEWHPSDPLNCQYPPNTTGPGTDIGLICN